MCCSSPSRTAIIGHWREAGGPLALRRKTEVDEAHKIIGIQGVVLDIHDGELEPTLENRRTITRLIRQWKANVVMAHRPNDYHPDHRYTGVLVQDAAYMVTVPFFCPDVPILKNNPAFFYFPDRFQKPNPFKPDVVVSVDEVMEKKLDALAAMESQFYEGGANGSAELMPSEPAKQKQRHQQVRDGFARRNQGLADRFRSQLGEWYPSDKAKTVKHAEAFELCEYGAQPDKAQLKKLFPFFD
jgi:LmbE family N-acetylglucosaminyl deacetylase